MIAPGDQACQGPPKNERLGAALLPPCSHVGPPGAGTRPVANQPRQSLAFGGAATCAATCSSVGSTPPFLVTISFVEGHREDAALQWCDGTRELNLSRPKIWGMRQELERIDKREDKNGKAEEGTRKLDKGVDSSGASHPLITPQSGLRARREDAGMGLTTWAFSRGVVGRASRRDRKVLMRCNTDSDLSHETNVPVLITLPRNEPQERAGLSERRCRYSQEGTRFGTLDTT